MDRHLRMLDVDGVFVNVGAPVDPLSLRVFSLIGNRRSFAGSPIGGIAQTQELLDFCARKNILPDCKMI